MPPLWRRGPRREPNRVEEWESELFKFVMTLQLCSRPPFWPVSCVPEAGRFVPALFPITAVDDRLQSSILSLRRPMP
jgi:hypothetical protein